MNTFDPYTSIEKVPLFTEDGGMQSKMYSIKMEVPYETKEGTTIKKPCYADYHLPRLRPNTIFPRYMEPVSAT